MDKTPKPVSKPQPNRPMGELYHYLMVRGVDQCRLVEIVQAAKDAGMVLNANPHVSTETVVKQLERVSAGDLAETVLHAHTKLVSNDKILASECMAPVAKPRASQILL